MSSEGDSISPVSPAGKANIQAELEELRRQQISKSNAQRLDSAPVTPINLQDWQLQQKALKDKERLSKTDAAAQLHSYRGQDEVKSQLSSIKQEDRKGKEEAARLLHGYRTGVGVIKTTPKNSRKPTPLAPGVEATQETGMEGVSVEDLAANYDRSGQMEGEVPAEKGDEFANPPALADEPKDQNSPGGSSDSGIMVESPTQQTESAQAGVANTSTEGWVAVEQGDAPAEAVAKAASLVVKEPAIPMQGIDTAEHTKAAPNDVMETSPKQVDVEFAFGLLFSDFIPNVDKYMAATAEIVSSIPSVVYNPEFAPFVRDVQEDPSFTAPPGLTGAKKCVVRATAIVFIMPGHDMELPRSQVWTALRAAIDDGSFLEIAKRH